MAYSWKIIKAAIEQVVLFPSKLTLNAYFSELARKGEPYEIVRKTCNDDGTVTVVVRKRYNQNEFLGSADDLLFPEE